MELYIHYPFCVKKCHYCDFLSAPTDRENRALYLKALVREIRTTAKACRGKVLDTIFIGGGTPSLMEPKELAALMDAVRGAFSIASQCEITMEANPGTLNRELLDAMKASGINRLSLGLQSTDNDELYALGRIHQYEDFCESFQMARTAGFENINVDLMSGLPGQTVASWEKALKKVAALRPEHISAYSLIIEEGTPFYELYGEDAPAAPQPGTGSDLLCSVAPQPETGSDPLCTPAPQPANRSEARPRPVIRPLPDEEAERLMYARTKEILEEYGYCRYEISNYARPGFECRHNVGYWRREEYLGVGLGAASLMNGERFENTRDFKEYLAWILQESFNGCRKNIQVLCREDAMAEFMFLGLRLMEGVRDRDFLQCFGQSFMEVYGQVIRQHCREGLLHYIEETGQLYLTERGIDLSNYVLCDFV